MKAIRYGFTSIMFDGSALPHEENLQKTAEIVKVVHAFGVSVEGEIGYLGFEEGADEDPGAKTSLERVNALNLTSPEEARRFAEATKVDALAIAIGNMHGHYRGEPKLDFERLEAIRGAAPCSLVLHGGSGISDGDFVRAIRSGIRKVNIYTAMNDYALEYLRDNLDGATSWVWSSACARATRSSGRWRALSGSSAAWNSPGMPPWVHAGADFAQTLRARYF